MTGIEIGIELGLEIELGIEIEIEIEIEIGIEIGDYMVVQISSGQGPSECQLAAAKLFEALQKEYKDLRNVSYTKGEEKGCFHSIRFETEHDLSGLEGTVLWICQSPFRRNHRRKNWYVDVSIIPGLTEISADKEYRIEKFQDRKSVV